MKYLILMALISFNVSAEYADISYRNGLELKSVIRVSNIIYAQAEVNSTGESLGVGLGYNFNNFNVIMSVNQLSEEVKSYNSKLYIGFYDVNYSYDFAISYSDSNQVGYELNLGYALNEKVSLIVGYSDDGGMIGLRRWIF